MARATILVADDEASVRNVLDKMLSLLGCRVSTVTDGAEAIAYLARHPVDAVVTDVTMPRKDGLEVLAYVQENRPCTCVVAMSGFADRFGDVVSLFGDSNILKKPFSLADVIQVLERNGLPYALPRRS